MWIHIFERKEYRNLKLSFDKLSANSSNCLREKTKQTEHLTSFCGYSSVLLLLLSDHTLMKWFGLEGTLNTKKFQHTCHECHPLDQVVQC